MVMTEHDTDARLRRALHGAVEPLVRPGAPSRVERAVHARIAAAVLRQDVAATRRLRRHGGLVAGLLAGALLAGALAVGFDLRRGAVPSGSTAPATSVHATPAAVAGADSRFVWVQLDLASAPARRVGVRVLDWNGRLHAAFLLPPPGDSGINTNGVRAVSPDGTRALLLDGTVIDDTGRVAAGWPPGALGRGAVSGVMWASDNRQLCVASPTTNSVTGVFDAGAPKLQQFGLDLWGTDGFRRVTVLTGSLPYPAGAGMPWGERAQVLACSVAQDRAVVARYAQTVGNTSATPAPGAHVEPGDGATVWVVQLSTGRVLRVLADVRVENGRSMIASPDGRLLVEFPPGPDPGAPPRIVRVDDGTTLPGFGNVDVAAISADDTQMVMRTYGNIGTNQAGHDVVSLVDIATRRVLWTRREVSGAEVAVDARAPEMIVAAGYYIQGAPDAALRLLLVDATGAWRELPIGLPGSAHAELAGPQPLSKP
jgi:hypothetical protein